MKKTLCFIFLMFSNHFVSARVLNLADEKFASYFSGETSSSLIKSTPYSGLVSGVDTFSNEYKTNYGGEFGFIYSSPYVAWRFSFEFLKPSKLTGVEASQGSTVSYLVTSDLTTVAPKLGVQINLNKKAENRFYLFGFYGSASLTMTNTYSQASVADHQVQAKSTAPDYGGGLGFEYSLVDTTTICFELGYRSLSFKEIKYSKDVTTFQGNKVAGDLLQDINGDNIKIDFTSYFASIGFRFWL